MKRANSTCKQRNVVHSISEKPPLKLIQSDLIHRKRNFSINVRYINFCLEPLNLEPMLLVGISWCRFITIHILILKFSNFSSRCTSFLHSFEQRLFGEGVPASIPLLSNDNLLTWKSDTDTTLKSFLI
ncbi:hypothetical protein RCL_jg12897.t1 [Rhizophagus clarus]|uniref:Uncharacterized protein n=1 Tax=Rhizophagus clarus TaxID=94130 RepID=A0A8H3KX12_9GLOM|nr:hypothetical protein RCL_jg12897.t1 [Rhizophagus clarus]